VKDEKVQEALNILRADYYTSVRATAEDMIRRIKSGEIDSAEALETDIHETADGSYWVIYTHANLQCMQASDNWLEAEDAGHDEGNLSEQLPTYAFYAFRCDLAEQLEAEGIDLSNPTGKDDES
jgi:hypothetical protein